LSFFSLINQLTYYS